MDKTDSGENGKDISRNESQEQTAEVGNKNEVLPKNPLLYLFVQYVWDPRHGPCYEGYEYKKLENWLETVDLIHNYDDGKYMIFRHSDGSPFCTPKKPMSLISFADFQRKTQDSRDMIILTHVGYHLRGMIELLNLRKEDVIHKNKNGRSLLHEYLRECRDVPVDAPEHEISIIRKVIKGLIELGTPLYAMDWRRETPFRLAAKCKNRQILLAMISSLADVEEHDKSGNTALHFIVDNCVDEEGNHKDGHVDLVRTLVSKGANVNAKNSYGATPVHLASENFQVEMLKLFADEGANFDERTNDDKTPMQYACKSTLDLIDSSKIIETFDFLVSKGCDLKVVDEDGSTLLHLAAEFCHCVQVVERLIALGVKVDYRTVKTLLTPLYLAAKGDKLDNMKALLRAGADVNAEAADGSTPIFMSALAGSYESMQFLIDQGADLHRRDSLMGFTLLHMAANGVELRNISVTMDDDSNCNIQAEQQNRKLKKLELLIDKGLDVNDAGYCGVSPLQLVALAPNVDAVNLLLDRGANVNFQNQYTVLELALMICDRQKYYTINETRRGGTGFGCDEIIRLKRRSIPLGVYPDNIENDDARLSCPIKKLWSCEERRFSARYLDIVSVLIDRGADVNVENDSGESLLHLVTYHKDGALKKLLDAGAHVNVQNREGRLPMHNIWGYDVAEGLSLMLDFGADINDNDISELLVSERRESTYAAIKHAIKLKLVGLPIARVYEALVHARELANFYKRCSEEAIKLTNYRDGDGFSLYEFLRMNSKFQYHYIDKITRDYKNLEELFPMYAGLIRGACRECAIRRQRLEPARIAWAENSGIYLPDVCVERILSYLSNRYLKVLATTFKEIKTTNVCDKKTVFKYVFHN